MTAAPGPLGAPAGVATIQPAGVARYSGRWAEAALLALMAVAVTAGCLACYVLYFNLAPFPSFVAGAAPLAAAGLASGVLAAAVAFA